MDWTGFTWWSHCCSKTHWEYGGITFERFESQQAKFFSSRVYEVRIRFRPKLLAAANIIPGIDQRLDLQEFTRTFYTVFDGRNWALVLYRCRCSLYQMHWRMPRSLEGRTWSCRSSSTWVLEVAPTSRLAFSNEKDRVLQGRMTSQTSVCQEIGQNNSKHGMPQSRMVYHHFSTFWMAMNCGITDFGQTQAIVRTILCLALWGKDLRKPGSQARCHQRHHKSVYVITIGLWISGCPHISTSTVSYCMVLPHADIVYTSLNKSQVYPGSSLRQMLIMQNAWRNAIRFGARSCDQKTGGLWNSESSHRIGSLRLNSAHWISHWVTQPCN